VATSVDVRRRLCRHLARVVEPGGRGGPGEEIDGHGRDLDVDPSAMTCMLHTRSDGRRVDVSSQRVNMRTG
jgi:hypothetical protein